LLCSPANTVSPYPLPPVAGFHFGETNVVDVVATNNPHNASPPDLAALGHPRQRGTMLLHKATSLFIWRMLHCIEHDKLYRLGWFTWQACRT